MNILILSSSFPTHENDVLSAKFIKDQIENFKSFDENVVFHVLVANRSKHSFENNSKHYQLHKFRYFFSGLEVIGNEDIKAQLKNNKAIYLLIPFYFISQFVSTLNFVKRFNINKIHVHFFIPQAYIALKMKKYYKIPFNITIHSAEIVFFVKRFKILGKIIARKIIFNAERIWVTSENTKNTLLSIFSQEEIDELDIIISPMGLNTDHLDNIKESDVLGFKSKQNILYVGRFVEKKGVINLIKAFAKIHNEIPEYKLIMAGDGHLKKNINSLVEDFNLKEKIIILDKVNEKEKKYLFNISEILVVPSASQKGDIEGMPVVILEGLYYKKLVLTTKDTFCDHVIKNNKNGFIIGNNDSESLAEKLLEIINIDNNLKLEVMKNAKNTSLDYGSEVSYKKYKAFLD